MKIRVPSTPARELTPAGSHFGVCCTVVDLGTQNGPYGAKRQLYLAWELPEEWTSKHKPQVVGRFYTLSAHPSGGLRQDLESWFGRVLTSEEIGELDLAEALLSRTATIGIAHAPSKSGQLRANVTSVMLPPKDRPEKDDLLSAPASFGFDGDFDRHAYDALPEWLRTIIARSPEYARASNPTRRTVREALDERLNGGAPVRDDLDDDIPFITGDPALEPYLKKPFRT